MRPSVIKIIKDAGYDLNFVLRLPWLSVWILLSLIALPILGWFDIVTTEFAAGFYISMIPTALLVQKLMITNLAKNPKSQ